MTLYNGTTNSTVMKRIVGVGVDAIRACGEYSSKYAAIAKDGRTDDDADDCRIRRGADDDDCEAETRRAGVPHDPRFSIPFCRSILSSAKGGRNDNTRSGGDRGGGGIAVCRVLRGATGSLVAGGGQPPPFHRQPPLRPGAGVVALQSNCAQYVTDHQHLALEIEM